MSRGITSALNTVFTSQSIRPFVAVDLAFSGANVRVWTGLGNITFASTTFVGTGEVWAFHPSPKMVQFRRMAWLCRSMDWIRHLFLPR